MTGATTRREGVVAEIRRAIVTGDLRPGDRLPEVRLAARFEVSRPTLREACNALVQDGLLVQEPYRGLRVATLDAAAIRDIATTRVALDLIAVQAILADRERMRLVESAWETYRELARDPDPLVRHDAHVALHRGLWAASENTMLLRLWPVTEALSTIVLAQDQAAHDDDPDRALDIHGTLVRAILSGDLPAIEAELARHTVDSADELIDMSRRERGQRDPGRREGRPERSPTGLRRG